MKEFEDILDIEEQNMMEPRKIFGFALVAWQKIPSMNINEIIRASKMFLASLNSKNSMKSKDSIPISYGTSRAERRANSKQSKPKHNQAKKKKKKR